MEQRNGRKAEEGRIRIKLPYMKWPLRMLLYFLTLLSAGLSLATVLFHSFHKIVEIAIFVAAGCGLALSCCYLYQDLWYGVREKIKPGIETNSFTRRVISDYRYRTVLFAHSSLAVNLLFALSNGVFGIVYHSVWFGALSGYYLVLSVMRFIAIRYERKHRNTEHNQVVKRKELYAFRNSGILFIVLTLALFISVIQMVFYGQVKNYPGTLIFEVAAYTFYKIGIAVFHLFKVGRMNSLLLRMIRNIGYADALVSLVSLQTAMFVSFGDGTDTRTMNLLTGGVVCLMILLMGIYMIRLAGKQLAQME
ncbi:MAG TPA: hypothetical protein DEQ64_05985 [Lachnoclostridium sp.]|nr:hypothetical protein [Lachnoclostridium sp.]